jgi:predicted nucleic acid-binding protein
MFYFDTSFIAPLILPEATSDRIEKFIQKLPVGELAVSHWTQVEFSSLLARRVRMKELTRAQAGEAMAMFSHLLTNSYHLIIPGVNDYDLATHFLRLDHSGLRAGDALHLAIAKNHSMEQFYTLDKNLVKTALELNIPATPGIY